VSYLLELLGKGLDNEIGDVLDRYFWSPSTRSIEELAQCCQDHPDWPDARLKLGVAHLRALRVDEAIEHLSAACRHKPEYTPARLALAAAFDDKGQTARALEQLNIANLNAPGEPPILFAIGFCLERLDRPGEAADYYRDAIDRDASLVPARERLAALAVYMGEIDEAIEQYECLERLTEEHGWTHTALAHLHYRKGDHARAVEEFETAIAMEPANWSLLDDEVEALVAEGQVREAIERLGALIEEQPGFADLYVRLGDLYGKAGNDDAAMMNYRAALSMQPDYLEAMVKLGTQHLVAGRWDEAAEAFHDACQRNEQVLVNYIGLGVAQLAGGDKQEAMNSFELAATIEPNSTLLLSETAKLQLKTAVAEEFIKNFRGGRETPVAEISLDNDDLLHKQVERHGQQVARHPGRADMRYRYGVLLRSQGRLGEAMEQFAAAVDINGSYVQAIIKLGITQQQLGQDDDAIETYKRAVDLAPEHVDIHYRLGLLYTDRRQFEQAARHMEIAVDGAPNNEEIRAGLALALQNMGLMDRSAATWRSLWQIHHTAAG